MQVPVEYVSGPLKPAALGEKLFGGGIVIFREMAGLEALMAHARACCAGAFGPDVLETGRLEFSKADLLARAGAANQTFSAEGKAQALFAAFFREAGLPVAQLYADQHRLRTSPSGTNYLSDRVRHVPPHRDSWGSGFLSQLNWWGPLHDIEDQQNLTIYPRYWDTPIRNDSADWDFETLLANRRGTGPKGYPTLPTAQEPPNDSAAFALPVRAGDLACFSAAHLHASAENRSGRARFNIETRTVNLDDLAAGRQAPNIDSPVKAPVARWFSHCQTGAPLTDAL